ncbi:fatty acid desaturase family protein [Nostoc commune]|uniref:fatty acid desaturase family protein n=1 Tax=Nostoc commune TaxID=1178 RepID=UPI0018C4A448|nr:fatty acid desaturase [Nostoc commune]MBG1261235.1 fatty acid desaturase [Nostoc commune BAE]
MAYTEGISLKRPQLPSEWHYPSLIGSFAYIVYTLALYAVPAILARVILLTPLPLPVAILLMLPLIWLAAHGILLFAWVGHEGFHLSLHRNKFVSALTGTFFASALPTYFETGAAISHWNHHRFTNQASDPDCQIFQQFQSFWSRLFLARIVANFKYFTNTVKMALNQPLSYSYKFPFKSRSIIVLAWANITFSLLWLAFYIYVTICDPVTGLVSILLPATVMYFISSLQPYLEHTGTEIGLARDAKTQTSPIFTWLYFGNNYHLEHHLYPGVPCYRLPAVHRLLKEQGFYNRAESGAFIESSVVKPYVEALFATYPQPGNQDSASDPMVPA